MKRVFLILGVFVFLFISGCSDKTAIENPTTNKSTIGTVSILGSGGVVGAAKVDSYNSGACPFTCDPDREDNTIAPDQTQLLWVNGKSVNECGHANFYYRIFDGDRMVVDCTHLETGTETCPDDYHAYFFTAPSASLFKTSKTANLVFYCGVNGTCGGRIISGDSFKLVDNGSCVK